VACFAAGVGGADAVTIAPHDVLLQPGGSALGRRVARNTQSILLLESNLARVTDPAGGSWYVEHFTDDLARTAWAGVQEVEAAGGIASALTAGLVATHLERATSARHKVLATRRRQLTGLTEFPDIGEAAPPTSQPAPTSPAGTPFPPLAPVRLADDFERQRERADRHATSTGQRPLVFVATLGPASAHTDRLTFAKNMFEVAGIRTQTGEVADFAGSGATVACLCSSNPIYQEHGANAAADLRAAGATRVYLAGRGLDIDGVDEEVGTGVDVLDALTRALDHLGVAP
jgi:methylmalonyl-CoA mutase